MSYVFVRLHVFSLSVFVVAWSDPPIGSRGSLAIHVFNVRDSILSKRFGSLLLWLLRLI